jgi:hypothetical protein
LRYGSRVRLRQGLLAEDRPFTKHRPVRTRAVALQQDGVEVARVLRHPRLLALHGLSEKRIQDYTGSLPEAGEIVALNPLLIAPIRDFSDIAVMQTAVIGEADFLCTRDRDFYTPEMLTYLEGMGTRVLDDVALIDRLRP